MASGTRRSGLSLVVIGIMGVLFFLFTDPHYGWLSRPGAGGNLIDHANEMFVGTVVGIVASLVIFMTGVWLMSRDSDQN